MTLDDATVLDGRTTDAIPAPRTSTSSLDVPWLMPGRFSRSIRPRSEYWDVETARWTSRPVVPAPRQGD